jgi:hypothetical protein
MTFEEEEIRLDAFAAIKLPDYLPPRKEDVIIALRAMQCALSVGEIHFETCVLSRQVKKQLEYAIKLLTNKDK